MPAPPAAQSDTPLYILVHDQQVQFEPGRVTTYNEVAAKIQNPNGLAAGSFSVAWRPDTDVVTVHKLLVRRGSEVIDVLASGQTFTVMRREQNLESSMLDGVLTANIQPEGLQVGDVLDVSYTISSSDPVLGDHVESAGGAWNVSPIGRAHLSVQWPDALHVNARATPQLPAPTTTHRGGVTRFEVALDNAAPLTAPKGAPLRYSVGRLAEFTSFNSWADLSALFAPLYDHASTLPASGPLLAEVARIRDASPDPMVRSQAALTLVQDRVRYVALAMGEGGLVPADAETTWARRFGDCKGKTALLLAILRALDIQAEPVVVNTQYGDGLDQRLPMIGFFDHVLVRATIAGKTYWLDGTRSGDTSLEGLRVPDFGWGLPIVAQGGALVRMRPAAFDAPTEAMNVRVDATAGIDAPAPIHAELVLRGDTAVSTHMAYSNLPAESRDSGLRAYWREQFDDAEITTTSEVFDPQTREVHLVMDGRLRMNWRNGNYRLDNVAVGYRADFTRDPGPDSDAPFVVPFPFYRSTSETIQLPAGERFRLSGGDEINQTVAGLVYTRRASLTGSVFTVEATEKSIAPEFPAAEAAAAQATLRSLADRVVYLTRPSDYRPTDRDIAAAAPVSPTDAAGLVRRASIYLSNDRTTDAMADLNRALALDAHNVSALALRGVVHAMRGETQAATQDLDAAAAIDPNNPMVPRARGALALENGATNDAIAAFSQVLAIDPNDAYALSARARAYHNAGHDDQALADAAAALQHGSHSTDIYLMRANIYLTRGDFARGAAEADALKTANADDAYAHVVAGMIYSRSHRRDDAMGEFERAIAIGPEAYMYVNRAGVRPRSDLAGRLADADAALQLEPNMPEALELKASVLEERHDYATAITMLSQAMHGQTSNTALLTRRGIDYALSGQQSLAQADFTAARSHANSAGALNNMCWDKATANVALDSALADCDAALAMTPDSPGIIDSRAFVLLRLGRLDDAIAGYDRALSLSPRLSASLYGRGLAWEQKGDQTKADADIAAAIQIDDGIRDRFEGFGLHRRPAQ